MLSIEARDRVHFDAADSVPGKLDAKIYNPNPKLLQYCYIKISLASSRRYRVGPFLKRVMSQQLKAKANIHP